MRAATQEESLGAELVNKYLSGMKADLIRNRGARRYVDVQREGAPRFPGDPQTQDDDEDMPDLEMSDDEPEEEWRDPTLDAAPTTPG